MKSLENKLIIYDSNCKVCSSLKEVVIRLTSIPKQKIKAYMELSPALSPKVDPEKFKNVMALIDTDGGTTIYGAEGVAYIFSSQYKVLDVLLRFKPFFQLFSWLYKVTAYNRYVIATPKSRFKCDCFPDKVVSYRVGYISITISISILLTALFGMSLKNYFTGMSNSKAALEILLIAGSGWALQLIAAALFMKKDALEYVGHLGSIMVVGLLILVPCMLFYFITGVQIPYVIIISAIVSFCYMVYLHIGRVRYLEISQWWSASWILFRLSMVFFWSSYFQLI